MNSDNEQEDLIETIFVGRSACLKILEKAWTCHRIFGVYGLRAIGKSRTVKEFFKVKTRLTCNKIKIGTKFVETKEIIVEMRYMTDPHSLYINLCTLLAIEPIVEMDKAKFRHKWKRQISDTISKRSDCLYLILFDNAEDAMDGPIKNELSELVSCYFLTLENIRIFITSTTKAMFSRFQKTYFTYELGPMPNHEASELLEKVASDIDFGEFKDSIVRLCEGLPLVLLMVGSEMTAEEGMITPQEMVEFLTDCRLSALSRENYPENDRVGDVYKKFINRLSEIFHQRLAILGYIPGSFNYEETKSMLDQQTLEASESLRHYRTRSMITYDTNNRRFNIQGVLRECLNVYFCINNLPEIRRRYCETFVNVMKALCLQLGTDEYTKALSQFSQEQPNLQKLLTEVYHSTTETYPYFIKVVADCTELIERFMPNESQKFYDGCLEMAFKFGRVRDMATVHIAVGSMYTNIKGEFAAGTKSYTKALNLLRNGEKTIQKAFLYQRLGYNLYCRGKYAESIKFLKEAFGIHVHLKTDRTPASFQTFNSIGIVYNVMGNFKEAEKYFFEGLRRSELIQGKDHYGVGAAKNNIGLMYGCMGENELALKFYTEGFEIKRKAASTTPTWSLVYSMNNIADIYCRMGQYSKATALLEEAMQNLNQETFPHKGALCLTYDTLGKLLLYQGKFIEASEQFEKAVAMKEKISAGGVFHVESMVHLAKAQQMLGKNEFVVKLSKKILSLSGDINTAMPTNTFISDTMEVLADAYRSMGKHELVKSTLECLQSELMRQELIHMSSGNNRRNNEITSRLNELELSLKQTQ